MVSSEKRKGLLKNYSKMEIKKFPFVACLLAFPILQFLVFYLYININSFILGMTDLQGEWNFKYIKIVLEEFSRDGNNLWAYLGRSVFQWLISTFVCFPIAILFAYALFKKVKFEMFFRVLFCLPGIIGVVVFASLFTFVVAADGPIVTMLEKIGIQPSEQLYLFGFLHYEKTSFATVTMFGIWLALSSDLIVLTGALTRIPEEIFESGRLEGIGFFREFFQMVIPLIWPTISTLLVFRLAAITTFDYGTFVLLGETVTTDIQTMGYYLFMLTYNVSRGTEVANKPAALGLIITIVTVPVVLVIRWLIDKFTDSVEY